MKLTDAQLGALERWQSTHRQQWRAILGKCWMNAAYGPFTAEDAAAFQQLRNTLGPPWLAAYRKGDIHVGVLQYLPQTYADGTINYRILPYGGEAEAEPLAVGWGNLREARAAARHHKITLIEDRP